MAKVNKDILKPEEHAIFHFIKGALDVLDVDVPAGPPHKIGNREVVFKLPADAFVTRAEGTAGDGFDKADPKKLTLTPNAMQLAFKRLREGITLTDTVWAEVIREDLAGTKVEVPTEALAGLAIVQAEQPPPAEPLTRRTPAKRTGEKEVEITIKRLTKVETKYGAKKAS